MLTLFTVKWNRRISMISSGGAVLSFRVQSSRVHGVRVTLNAQAAAKVTIAKARIEPGNTSRANQRVSMILSY